MEKIFIAGHKGMVGSAMLRHCKDYEPITIDKKSLDLRDQQKVDEFIATSKPDKVVICSAKVGGIKANSLYPAEFAYDNLMIQTNIINSAYKHGVKRLLFLGSTCIYPKFAPQPLKEEYLLTNSLESTNEAYAIAKIAGIKLCEFYRKQYGVVYHSVMPTNLYGLNDNYHPENSHVIPGLIRKIHEAKLRGDTEYKIWGSGSPKREFLYADDLASICYKLLEIENPPNLVNAGSNTELSIYELTKKICKVVGFEGKILPGDPSLDGTPRKKTDCTLLNSIMSFEETSFEEGLKVAYRDFLNNSELKIN
jgi:GDP-L-fucose synthase